jgi:polyisoprenyl-phosphate glycosyltransferase
MLSIVIPVHNEEPVLRLLLERLRSCAPAWHEDYEVLFVDDGSHDRSVDVLVEEARSDPHLRIAKLTRNFGHQAAVSAGIGLAKGDAVVIMDADLQDPPEILQRFLEKWREGHKVVYGIRTRRKEGLLLRAAYSIFYRALYRISDIEIPRDSGDFCLMDRRVVDALKSMPEQVRFVRGLRAYAGFSQVGITYERAARAAGIESYTLPRLFKLAADGMFGFSMFPLRLASYLGFLIALPSFLIVLFFIVQRLASFPLFGRDATQVPGITTLAIGLFFLGGLNLIMLGVIGEYLGRIYLEVKQRPSFIIESIHPSSPDPNSDGAHPSSSARRRSH